MISVARVVLPMRTVNCVEDEDVDYVLRLVRSVDAGLAESHLVGSVPEYGVAVDDLRRAVGPDSRNDNGDVFLLFVNREGKIRVLSLAGLGEVCVRDDVYYL